MKRRGVTLIELLSAMMVLGLVVFGSTTLLVTGLQTFQKATTDLTLTQQNAQGLRHVSENIRQSMSVTLANSGGTIQFVLPKTSTSADAATGNKELIYPLVSDGVSRSYVVDFSAGTLTEQPGGRILVRNIQTKDPDPGSSQYAKAYAPFTLTTIGSRRAITINLITAEQLRDGLRYERLKTTVVIRNAQ